MVKKCPIYLSSYHSGGKFDSNTTGLTMNLLTGNEKLTQTFEELETELKSAKQKNSLFPDYLAGLSHDIRTPLNAVVGFAGLLTDPDIDSDRIKFYSHMITRSSRKLLSMISNLIDLAKMETGNFNLFIERVSISELLEDLEAEMQEEQMIYDKNDIQFSFQGPPNGSGYLKTDRTRLYQVLKILLDNSLKYTKEGTIKTEIKANGGTKIIFNIHDTGMGIDADTLNNLFSLFPVESDTTKLTKIKSRGLGMLLVGRITELLNAEIFIDTELGKGTTVSLVFPV